MAQQLKVASAKVESAILYCIFKYVDVVDSNNEQRPFFKMSALDYISSKVKAREFSFDPHRSLYEEILSFYEKNGTIPIYSSLVKYIEESENGNSDEVKKLIIKLNAAYEEVKQNGIRREEIDVFLQRFKKLAALRKFLSETSRTVQQISEEGFESSISKFIHMLGEIETDFKSTQSENRDLFLIADQAKVEEKMKQVDINGGVWYGIPTIDITWAATCPKLQPGELLIYQAKTNVGKSIMLMTAAFDNACKIDRYGKQKPTKKVLIITIEMNQYQYYYRLASRMSEIEHHFFTTGKIVNEKALMEQWERNKHNYFDLGNDVMICWRPMCSPSDVRRAIKLCPYEPELVIVDYGADMILDKDDKTCRNMSKSSAEGQGYLYESLKKIAGEFGCVMMTAQQLDRKATSKTAAEFGKGYGSSRPEQLSDVGIMLVEMDDDILLRDPGSETTRQLSIVLGKMRGTGFKGRKIKMKPRFSTMTWDDLGAVSEGDTPQNKPKTKAPENGKPVEQVKKQDSIRNEAELMVPDLES